jgi:preprotein translocase subunit YajC
MSGGIFVLVIMILFLIWLMMVRPQRRRRQMQQAMIDHLRIGDEVITAGGFFAVVRSKRAIAAVFPLEDESDAEPTAVEEPEPTGQPRR